MRNKRQISCRIFMKVLETKRHVRSLLQAVARTKFHQRTVWQMAELCSSATFLSLTLSWPFFSTTSSVNHTPTKNVLNVKQV
jgi:hypothetical protein